DQLSLGLKPWPVSKLYARWPSAAGAEISLGLNDPSPRLSGTPRDFAEPAAALLADQALPAQRFFHLLETRIEGAQNHRNLMQGINLAAGGTARRVQSALLEQNPDLMQAMRARR